MKRLLIRVKPFPGECYGGYTVRLARENGYENVLKFVKEFCNASSLPFYMTPLTILSRLTDIKERDRDNLWLKFRDDCGYTYKGHLVPRELVTAGKNFCAKCLSTGSYRKAQWNLAWLPVCLEHKTILTVGCKLCCGKFKQFKDARCLCISSGLEHAEQVSDEVVDFIFTLEKELDLTNDTKKWKKKLRVLLTEGYLRNPPYVYGRNYPRKTRMPDKWRCQLTPRRTVDIYKSKIESQKAA